MLRTEGLVQNFGGLIAVNDVNYSIKEGELAAIIGPNGAGKSTLFKLLVGTQFPHKGKIFFEDTEITNLPSHKRVGLGLAKAHQIVNIFPKLTVIQNMAIAAQNNLITKRSNFFLSSWKNIKTINKAEEILTEIQLIDKRDELSADLPQGKKKILEVGMALATDPKILLLDEPTAGSTPIETQQMMELIHKVKDNLTIIIVEHKMDVIMNLAERITVMHKGSIIAEGTPQEIRNDEVVREVYLGNLYARS